MERSSCGEAARQRIKNAGFASARTLGGAPANLANPANEIHGSVLHREVTVVSEIRNAGSIPTPRIHVDHRFAG